MAEVEQTNVKVMVRCRPFNSREINAENGIENLKSVVFMEGNTVRILDPEKNFQEREAFEFDNAFWSMPESQNQFSVNPFAGQVDVFEAAGAPAVENALKGYHNTIFAYGQTGSGKTHSMLGCDADEGVAPRLVRKLFAAIGEEKLLHPSERVQFSVELSFLEIYNEKVKDLLAVAERGEGRSNKGSTDYAECRVRFHPEKGTFVEGLKRMEIKTEQECLDAIKAGMEHRAVTSTLMNDTSSRSHAIFQICLSQKSPLRGTTRVSIVNLVDLAGSERIKMSGVTGTALKEAMNINLSLSTLRRVIDILIDNSKLKKGQRPSLPPFRESLLTWVLSDSLGGNSKTVMIAAVSPYAGNIEDTMGTLRYALKAKAIVCNAKVNEEKTAAVVSALRAEMDDLRKQLEQKDAQDKAEQERLEQALKQREGEFHDMQEESKRLDDLKQQYEDELKRKADELAKAQEQMVLLENVEEEKQKKEGELLIARELQAQTAQVLKQREEERKRKDDELAAVILRKNTLKRHHDRAMEEEAKARLAAEQARRRQFVTAFQNAFILGKQKTGLEDLKLECHTLEEKVARLENNAKSKENQYNELLSVKSELQRKVETLDKRCHSLQRDLQEVLQSKNDKIQELTQLKSEADGDLAKAQKDLSRKHDELERLKRLYAEEQEKTAAKIDALQTNHDQVNHDIQRKNTRLEQLKDSLKEAQERLAQIKSNATRYNENIVSLREENKLKEEQLCDLQRKKSMLEKQKEMAFLALQERHEQMKETEEELESVLSKTESLRQNHYDLRQYVTHKFFPVKAAPRAQEGGGSQPRSGSAHVDPTVNVAKVMSNSSVPRSGSQTRGGSMSRRATSSVSSDIHAPTRQWTNHGYRYQ